MKPNEFSMLVEKHAQAIADRAEDLVRAVANAYADGVHVPTLRVYSDKQLNGQNEVTVSVRPRFRPRPDGQIYRYNLPILKKMGEALNDPAILDRDYLTSTERAAKKQLDM